MHHHKQLVFILVCAVVCEELHTCVLRAEAAALHFYEDAKDQNSDLHACSTGPIPTDHFPGHQHSELGACLYTQC